MFHAFNANTADELWRQIYVALHDDNAREQASRSGDTREILHAALCLEDPRQRWIISRRPSLNLAFALAEVVWIVTGRKDSAFLTYFFPSLTKYMGDGPTFHGAYGDRLRHRFGLDQLDRAYQALRSDPGSRQVVLEIWDPTADLPAPDGRPVAKDVPCNLLSLLKVRDGRLEWMQVMRSNDFYRGLPHNVVQFTCLQEILAGWLDLELGQYHHISDSLHFYEEAEPEFGLGIDSPNDVMNTDSLACAQSESERSFAILARQVEQIINPNVTAQTLADQFNSLDLPSAYRNIACVLHAEGARRRHAPKLATRFMEQCTNRAYQALQGRWLQRLNKLN